ncbi:hypothetical protein EV643_110216 [Kribbella sp. VKM Ac-2527]|uniref:Uncharacterized protein n=1 Tax=Kribbella caucasensis TaxID=2512215 RepID=A0A4R6KC43_9ACTN|nr:hypothetical protein EV643_110216 [Kribbella sp. VKM Ac-2527]
MCAGDRTALGASVRRWVPWSRTSPALGCVAVVLVGEHGRNRRGDLVRGDGRRVVHLAEAEFDAALSIVRLIGAEGQQHGRQTVREGSEETAGAAVRDDQIAVRQQFLLRDEPLDSDVVRLRSQRRGIIALAHCHDHLRGHRPQTREHPREQVVGVRLEHRPQREVDGRGLRPDQGRYDVRGPVGERTRRQRESRAPEARRERSQDQIPVEHGEPGIRGQAVLGPQLRQRFRDELLAQQRSGREDEHARTGNTEPFGGDRGAEIDLIAHDHIGLPPAGDLEPGSRVPTCSTPREGLAEVPLLRRRVDLHQPLRSRSRRTTRPRPAGGEGREPSRFEARPDLARPGDRDGVPSSLDRASNWNQGPEMPATPAEREQDPYRPHSTDCPAGPYPIRRVHLRVVRLAVITMTANPTWG